MRVSVKIVMSVMALLTATVSLGQDEKIAVDAGADLVSSYVWRGMYQTGVSIQPSLNLSAYGVTFGAWGSTDFSTTAKELDFYLSYEINRFAIGLTDYWWSGEGASYFKKSGSHYLEVNLAYTLSEKFPLALGVNTMLFGDGDKDIDGEQRYSTYVSASYPFAVKDVDCEVGVGMSLWRGLYSRECNVTNISLRATKALQFSKGYALPIFVEAIFSPAQDNAYLIFGLKF